MVYLIMFFGFYAAYLTVVALYLILFKNRVLITERLAVLSEKPPIDQMEEELRKPFFDRVIKPVLNNLSSSVSQKAPAPQKEHLERLLTMAGNPGDLSPHEFMVIQYGLLIGLPVLAIVFTLPMGLQTIVLAAVIALLIGKMAPDIYLKSKARVRQEEIQKTLPDVLDLLTVSVEAGLGFDSALVKVIEKTEGTLAQEFSRVLQEIKMGKPRRDALRDLGTRTGVDELSNFISAIVQADQLGVSIGNVLRVQSEQMRQQRRQRAEEIAQKAPIKMLIPLIAFIFPTLFIVLLGPALIQFINEMTG